MVNLMQPRFFKIPWQDLYAYLGIAGSEEGIFRVIILGFLPNIWGFWISVIVYALAHFIFFKWPMVIATFILGMLLGWVYLHYSAPWGYIHCYWLHFIVGSLAWQSGLVKKWLR